MNNPIKNPIISLTYEFKGSFYLLFKVGCTKTEMEIAVYGHITTEILALSDKNKNNTLQSGTVKILLNLIIKMVDF